MNKRKGRYTIGMLLLATIMMATTACGTTNKNNNSGSSTPSEPVASASASGTGESSPVSASGTAELLKAGTLTIGVDATYPPFESFDDKNQMVGFDIELAEALASKLGLQPKWVDTRFEALIPGLNTKKYDTIISAISITEDRAKVVDFIPYFSLGQQYVARKDAGLSIADDHDIEGLSIAVLTGSIHYNLLNDTIIPDLKSAGKGDVKVSTYPTTPEAVQQVVKGTANVSFLDSPVAEDMIKKFDGLDIVSPVINPKNSGIVVRKGDADMAALIEQGLKALKEDGTLGNLLVKYGLGEPLKDK